MAWAKTGCLLMLLGIIFGAFGSHALENKVSDYHLNAYKTGVQYHLVHALGLFAVGWLSVAIGDPRTNIAGIFILTGIILFSGSLYLYAITSVRWLGFVTPFGGVSFLIGWFTLFLTIR